MGVLQYTGRNSYAFHVFSKGKHGLSLADEAWANEEFGEPYTLEQTFALGQAVNDGTFPVPEEAKQALNEMAKMFTGQTEREIQKVFIEMLFSGGWRVSY